MSSLFDAIAELETLGRPALAERWATAFGSPVPRSMRDTMIRRMLAWHLQVQASPQWRRPSAMKKLIRTLSTDNSKTLTPGTQLIRQWKEETHQVTVLTSGFEHAGKTYRSLSAVAHHITGTPWSGPLFFGLRT